MKKNQKLHTETVPLFIIYRKDNKLYHKKLNNVSPYEIFGYLRLLLNNIEYYSEVNESEK